MSKYLPRKTKKASIPDPMTSVIQEINGVKRKVTSKQGVISSAVKKPKILSTPHFEKSALSSTTEISPNKQIGKDAIEKITVDKATNDANDSEKPSSCIPGSAKGKLLLSLDPNEIKSISKIQNWTPPIRIRAHDKTENKFQQKFKSQLEATANKFNPLKMILTERQPSVWQTPMRRNLPATITCSTPAKRAKNLQAVENTEFPSKNKNTESECKDDECESWHIPNQHQVLVMTGADRPQDISLPQMLTSPTLQAEGKNLQIIGVNYLKDGFEQFKKSQESSITPAGIRESTDHSIFYSPIDMKNQEIQSEDLLEEIFLEEAELKANSQDSEQDIFLSQETTDNNEVVLEILSTDHSNENSMSLQCKLNPVSQKNCQKLSGEDMFESEIQSGEVSPFGDNLSNEETKLKLHSQTSSQSDLTEKDQTNKEFSEKGMVDSEQEKIQAPNRVEERDGESQQLMKLLALPPKDGSNVDAVMAFKLLTPPNNFEVDISSCPTVKRGCGEMPAEAVLDVTQTTPNKENSSDWPDEESSAFEKVEDPSLEIIKKFDSESVKEINAVIGISSSINNYTDALECAKYIDSVEVHLEVANQEAGSTTVTQTFNQDDSAIALELIAVSDENIQESVNLLEQNTQANLSQIVQVQEKESNFENLNLAEDKKAETELSQLQCTSDELKDVTNNAEAKKVEIPSKSENTEESVFEESSMEIEKKDVCNKLPKEVENEQENLKTQYLQAEDESISSKEAVKEPTETVSNEVFMSKDDNLIEMGAKHDNNKSDNNYQNIEEQQKISQEPENEPKKPTANKKLLPMEVDCLTSTTANKQDGNENRFRMKPYTYEMDQDFDISHSQLIEIESAFLQERTKNAGGPNVAGGLPRVAVTAPQIAAAKCGEARMPAFAMPNLPVMPTLHWKKKVQEDRQKLRAAIHEISRLNAMLMSVRREVWPTAGINPEAPPAPPPSNNPRQGQFPNTRRY